jgi:predicted transcriptional regulator
MKESKNNNGSNSGRKPDVSAFETKVMSLRAWQYKRQGYDDSAIAMLMGRTDRTIRRWIQHYRELEYGELEQQANHGREIYERRFWTWQTRADELNDEIDKLKIARANEEPVDDQRLEALIVQRDRAIREADRWKTTVEKIIGITVGALVKRDSQKSDIKAPQIEYDPDAKWRLIDKHRRMFDSRRETESAPDEKGTGRTDHGNREQE